MKDADIVVFVSGVSPVLEGEEMGVNLPGFKGGDRTDIELPAIQRELISALHRAGKKIILVNCSGSPIALEPETKNCEAILQVGIPVSKVERLWQRCCLAIITREDACR